MGIDHGHGRAQALGFEPVGDMDADLRGAFGLLSRTAFLLAGLGSSFGPNLSLGPGLFGFRFEALLEATLPFFLLFLLPCDFFSSLF